MRDNLTKHYPNLTSQERFQLYVRAVAEGEEAERERLAMTCPQEDYRMNDAAFVDRVGAMGWLTLAVALELGEMHSKVQLAMHQEILYPSLVREVLSQVISGLEECYEVGFKQGWEEAGAKGAPPDMEKQKPETGLEKTSSCHERYSHVIGLVREELQGKMKTLWEAFSEVCREDVGVEPELPLAAIYPPALEWVEKDLGEEVAPDVEKKARRVEELREFWQRHSGGAR